MPVRSIVGPQFSTASRGRAAAVLLLLGASALSTHSQTFSASEASSGAIPGARYGGTLYGATNHDPLQQVGVTLPFAALLGSLVRMWFLTLKGWTG